MSGAEHVHQWIEVGEYDVRCVWCDASRSEIQTMPGEAAEDARRLAGEPHYTGCRARHESETLELWLFDAPAQLLEDLEALRRGVYVVQLRHVRSMSWTT